MLYVADAYNKTMKVDMQKNTGLPLIVGVICQEESKWNLTHGT